MPLPVISNNIIFVVEKIFFEDDHCILRHRLESVTSPIRSNHDSFTANNTDYKISQILLSLVLLGFRARHSLFTF